MSRQTMVFDLVTKDSTEIFYIGAASGFFFIGTGIDFWDNIQVLNYKMPKRSKPIQCRMVLNTYKRLLDGGTVIIVEGTEGGRYWMRSEFERDFLRKE